VQVLEHLVSIATILAGIVVPWSPLRIYVLVALALHATTPLWAAHVPHRAPQWMTRIAARLAVFGSPVLLSLAHHDLHHRQPKVPCRRLAAVAREEASRA
jgi:fatty acid desaturase